MTMHEARIKEASDQIAKILVQLLEDIRTLNQQPISALQAPAKDEWMTIKEYAKHRNVSKSTIYAWMRAGMPVFKNGGLTRIKAQEADTWLAAGGLQRKVRARR